MFLEVKNLTKSFDGTAVLKGVDFALEKGQVLSLIGSSGSGKTTLLRCINALETADGGTISVDGNKIFDAALLQEKKKNKLKMPSTLGTNWKWRLVSEQVNEELAKKIYSWTKLYGRL